MTQFPSDDILGKLVQIREYEGSEKTQDRIGIFMTWRFIRRS